MSSGFVPGGTSDQPVEQGSDWTRAQQEIAVARRRKEDEGKQEGGKSLYEVLQANKASKQEAFEESIRLKNQFRALEEDEVEFLDSVLESTREKEAAVKKETSEQLEVFRKQREAADQARLSQAEPGKEETTNQSSTWTTNKKRRRGQVEESPAMKRRKSPSDRAQDPLADKAPEPSAVSISRAAALPEPQFMNSEGPFTKTTNATNDTPTKLSAALGLDDYDSEDN